MTFPYSVVLWGRELYAVYGTDKIAESLFLCFLDGTWYIWYAISIFLTYMILIDL